MSRRTLGAIVAGVFSVAVVVATLAVIVGDGSQSVFDTDVGDCFVFDPDEEGALNVVEVVECTEPHDAEIVVVGELNPERDRPYPPRDELFAEVGAACPAPTTFADQGYGVVPIAPNEASWDGQDGSYACVAVTVGGEMVTSPIDLRFERA